MGGVDGGAIGRGGSAGRLMKQLPMGKGRMVGEGVAGLDYREDGANGDGGEKFN